MSSVTLTQVESPFTYFYEEEKWSRSARQAIPTIPVVEPQAAVKKKNKFGWDEIIDLATDKIAGAVANEIVERLLGPDEWQQGVTRDLKAIVQKLDQILDEIRALRNFIREDRRAHWRAVLESKISTHIEIATTSLKGARGGALSGYEEEVFKVSLLQLNRDLLEVAFFKDPEIGQSVSLPLYAAVKAGMVMLAAGQKLLGATSETRIGTIESFRGAFDYWMSISTKAERTLGHSAAQKVKYLNDFPKRRVMAFGGGKGDPYYNKNYPAPRASACWVEISGSADDPFRLVNISVENFETMGEAKSASVGQLFPLPYLPMLVLEDEFIAPPPSYIGGINWAREMSAQMITELNAIRARLTEDLEQVTALQMLSNGLGLESIISLARSG